MEIHAAAFRGDLEGVKYCLSRGVPVDQRDPEGDTPLLKALHSRRAFDHRKGPRASTAMIRFLLECGADLNAAGYLGRTPIHAAAGSGIPEWVEMLCERGADPSIESEGQFSTLVSACYQPPSREKIRILRTLVERGVPVDRTSQYGESPLSVTLWFGDFAAVRVLLELGADRASLGWTSLHERVLTGTTADLREYSATAQELDQPDGRWELTPLFWAVKQGELDKVKCLAERGARFDQAGRLGDTALHIAASLDRAEVVEWLLAQGVLPNVENQFSTTPLMKACEGSAARSVRLLLQAGASGVSSNQVQDQAVHFARSMEILDLLVEKAGVDLNTISGQGYWPLKNAAEDNDVDRCEWLLGHGAEVDRTSTGETALHWAIRWDSLEVAQLLLERGANPNLQDVDGGTPLFQAKSRQAVQLLLGFGADPTLKDQMGDRAEKGIEDPLVRELLPFDS